MAAISKKLKIYQKSRNFWRVLEEDKFDKNLMYS